MTVAEILEQVKKLTPEERDELVERLTALDELEDDEPSLSENKTEHWGQSLNRLLDDLGPIELLYPEIEDPVAWVKQLRDDERRRRLGDWGDEQVTEETA